ncbi:MAG: phage portal protein [Sphingomonadaceae bacterium]
MSFLTTLTSAFKGGGDAARVPLASGYVSPWATALGAAQGEALTAQDAHFDYPGAARAAYCGNPVAQRAVRIVTEGVGGAPLAIDDPRLAALVSTSTGTQPLLEVLAAQLLLHGNAFVQVMKDAGGTPIELYPLRPDRVRVVAGEHGWPAGYRYTVGARSVVIAPEDADGWPNLIHLKAYHPLDDHYGAGCLAATGEAVAVHNAAARWNRALLDNAARPSGALVYRNEDSAGLTKEQFERLKDELASAFQGSGNAGRPMLLEGGLSWQSMALSPADMDFASLKSAAARDIALAFGVPPMLLGLPGDNTYANYREANRALWRLTLLPLIARLADGLLHGLAPWFAGSSMAVDLDRVPALAEDREKLWAQVSAADFLSDEEKRAMLGIKP